MIRLRAGVPVTATVLGLLASALANGAGTCIETPAARRADAGVRTQLLMSERVFRRLSNAQERLRAQDYAEALRLLRALESGGLSEYERALVLQSYGFLYTGQGEYARAIDFFERSLAGNALPPAGRLDMLYTLATLYAGEGLNRQAVETLETWFAFAQDPPAEAYAFLASNRIELRDFSRAEPCLTQALEMAPRPPESWFQMLLAIYREQERLQRAVELLRRMLLRWPDKLQYWELLASAYQLQNPPRDREALAVLRLAWEKNLLVAPARIRDLVQMHLFLDLPFEGGRLLETALEKSQLEADTDTLKLLLHAWLLAHEDERALGVLEVLAPLAADGEYYLRMARLQSERNEWESVAQNAGRALERGGLQDPGAAWLLQGVAFAEQGRWRDALPPLEAARRTGGQWGRQADSWTAYVIERQ